MSEEVKRNAIAWEPFAAVVCFVMGALALLTGFVFTTGWLLDQHVHPLLRGTGVVLLIIGIPMIILGGHFMDLSENRKKEIN